MHFLFTRIYLRAAVSSLKTASDKYKLQYHAEMSLPIKCAVRFPKTACNLRNDFGRNPDFVTLSSETQKSAFQNSELCTLPSLVRLYAAMTYRPGFDTERSEILFL